MNSFKEIIQKGIDIQVLLDSNVFIFNFDFDDWPTSHPNNEECLRPYNFDSIINIRSHYRLVFPEKQFRDHSERLKGKVNKISFSINFLPMMGMHVTEVYNRKTYTSNDQVVNPDFNLLKLLCQEG